ncbi:MAG TPA: hypothetical protein VEV62_11140 [Parafilimonas sp.]|jgi:hypothetical protein|nr:hypothetical protein [Parafilimonas sp.]
MPFLYLLHLMAVCRCISYLCACLHYIIIKVGVFNVPVYLAKRSNKKIKTLHKIWYVKLTRRMISFLIRTPLRKSIVRWVNFNISIPQNQGCIIVTCHTPWKRLITNWCVEQKFGLVIGGGSWSDRRRGIQKQGAGISELRHLVKHLQSKGRVITNADVFNNLNNCQVKFLGNNCNVSLFSERLAVLAKVPLITVIPRLSETTIEFTSGPQFPMHDLTCGCVAITQQIISFFEKEIENDPTIWSTYVK